jgi:6-phosphogluconate dehydrogenase
MMQSYAEGLDLIAHGTYEGQLDLTTVTNIWQQGSIIRSFLGQLAHEAVSHPSLIQDVPSVVGHNGEALWMVEEGERVGIATPATKLALDVRKASAEADRYANRVLSALRYLFGGHTK